MSETMESLKGANDVTSPSPLASNVKIKCLTGTHMGTSRFPRLNECAHFHYDIVEIGSIQASLSEDKRNNQEIRSYITTQPSDDRSPSFCVSVKANGNSWVIRRTYDNFYMLDRQVHRCIYDRKYSQLPELPISEELFDFISSSEQEEIPEDGLRTMLQKYLDRFSILAGNLINCGPVLNWFELDNRGNRLLVPEESAINTPAVGAAYVIKRYSAQATDEISFEVGDMISVIDMPPPEDSIWWRGKKGFQVGFFPCDCVEIISEKIPKNINIPNKTPSKPVLRKHGKLITFFRSFILTRPSRRKLKQRGILKERVFSCDLGEHLLNSGQDIPMVLKSCTEFIEEHGVVDGIYRLSGVTSNIQKLRVAFDEERVPDLHEEAILQDIHCVASLLKMYFRELPNPLLTYQLYDKFVNAVQSNDDVRLIKMRDIVHQLPPPHYRTLEYLIRHLARVSTHGNNTGMGPKNLAIVWAPNLLRSKDLEGGSVAALHVVGVQAVLTEYLIRYSDLIFNDKMPVFTQHSPAPPTETPKRSRPKSLAISTPTKLLSLEEARSRAFSTAVSITSHPADSKYIEVGGGPTNLPAKYHTIIELPGGKRGSTKLKKSPMGWKSFFSKSRHISGGSHREKHVQKSEVPPLQHQFSLNAAFQEKSGDDICSNTKRLRTVKSVESLMSSCDYSYATSEAGDDSCSILFNYTQLVSSQSRLSSEEPSECNDPVVDELIMKPANQDDQHSNADDEQMQNDNGLEDDAQIRKIKIDIGADKITESASNEGTVDDSTHDRKASISSTTERVESTSPKTHKFSLKQKFKQAFTSPPSIRKMSVPDEQSPFKRSPASFRDKIVKTFSPESLRKKQVTPENITLSEDGAKLSPTAPPRRKQRKKANIEEDFDSSDSYRDDEDMNNIEDSPVQSPISVEAITSPDSIVDNDPVNETVTVEVHAADGSPNDLSDFEKSFLNKSEKSLLEEVTSELAQKSASEPSVFSVFPSESQFVRSDSPVEVITEDSVECSACIMEEEVGDVMPDGEIKESMDVSEPTDVIHDTEVLVDQIYPDAVPETVSLEPRVIDADTVSDCDDRMPASVIEHDADNVDTASIKSEPELPCDDQNSANQGSLCELSENTDNSDNVFVEDSTCDSSNLSKTDINNEQVPESCDIANNEVTMRPDKLLIDLSSVSKSRIHSWNTSCGIIDVNCGSSPRGRWSYPSASCFSPLDDSKRKFESEIGRDIVRDRRMKHELQQIQALNLKNKQQSPSSLHTSANPVPFEIHALKPIPPSDISVPEPAEADIFPDKKCSNLPEVGARTGSVSSENSTEENIECTTKIKTPTSPQRSMIPRPILPSSPTSPKERNVPPSPSNNNKESVEMRKPKRNNSSCNQRNIRNSEPNNSGVKCNEQSIDIRTKRHSESEIMTKSFPPRISYRKQEPKASVKELLNRFEKKTDPDENSSHCSSQPKPSGMSYESSTCVTAKNEHKQCNSKFGSNDTQLNKSEFKPEILENVHIVIADKADKKMEDDEIKDPVLERPTTLFNQPKLEKNSKQTVSSPTDSISSKTSNHSKESLSSPGSLDVKSLLNAVGDIDDAARRERINKYKEKRRAQLREKMIVDTSPSDDKTSPTKTSYVRSSPTRSSLKQITTAADDNGNHNKDVKLSSSCPSNSRFPSSNTTNNTTTKSSSLPKGLIQVSDKNCTKDKEILIVENIPKNICKSSSAHQLSSPGDKLPPKGIKDRVALFEKEKLSSSSSSLSSSKPTYRR